jgi:hypothetical protein
MSKMSEASFCVDHHRITLGGNAHSAMKVDNTAKELISLPIKSPWN